MPVLPALFLDRDGVINRRLPDAYVTNPAAFELEPGAAEALALLASFFAPIVVVTNQAGIGKGLMSENDLSRVHEKMLALAAAAGGRIDRVYYCPHRSDAGCACRKPATGMALQARVDFPEIVFENAWMVGDSASDMALGKTLGMHTALIHGKEEEAEALASVVVNQRFDSLLAFARFVKIFNN